jgi:peptidase S51-like protein
VTSPPRTITILGPQRRPTLGDVVATLESDAPIAMVTAGWQEREPDDAELDSLLGGRGVRLGLHARWLDVLERDRDFAHAELEHRSVLDELQQLYLVQLDHALRALYTVAQRARERPRTKETAMADAMAVVRLVDQHHVARVKAAHGDFYAAWQPDERPVVAAHREAVRTLLELTAGLVVAGGHVGVLVRVLHLFHVTPFIPATVVGWSAGAMALTERVVLFHDRAPQGPAHAEIYDEGLGLIPGAVLLPHARRRLRVDDLTRMSVLASRFAPATCVVLDDGMRLDLVAGGALPPGARLIGTDGRIRTREMA